MTDCLRRHHCKLIWSLPYSPHSYIVEKKHHTKRLMAGEQIA